MSSLQDEIQHYYARIRPIYNELFSVAYVIGCNYELAEYTVQRAILEGWRRARRFRGKLGFREGIRSDVRRFTYTETLIRRDEQQELTWEGFGADSVSDAPDEPFFQLAAQETSGVRRILALRYGCGFTPSIIAKLTGTSVRQVRQQISRFEKGLRRRMKGSQRRQLDAYCMQCARQEFAKTTPNTPDIGAVYRTFQMEACRYPDKNGVLRKIARGVGIILAATLIGMIFWLAAVMTQPAVLEETAQIQPTDMPKMNQELYGSRLDTMDYNGYNNKLYTCREDDIIWRSYERA